MAEATKLNQDDFQIILDVRSPKNRPVQFGPMVTDKLIPDFRADEQMGGCAESVKQIKGFPQHRILIRTRDRERAAVVHHQMNDATKERDIEVRRALANEQNGSYTFGIWPPDINFDLNNDDQYATFMWWCKKLHDAGLLYLVKGTLPGYDRIRSIGEVQHCVVDMGMTTKTEYRNDEKYATTVLPKRPMSEEALKRESLEVGAAAKAGKS